MNSEEGNLLPKGYNKALITVAGVAILGAISYKSYNLYAKQKKAITIKGEIALKDPTGKPLGLRESNGDQD